jgi:hypothetical protein
MFLDRGLQRAHLFSLIFFLHHIFASEFMHVTLLMLTYPFSADGAFADAPAPIVALPTVPGYFLKLVLK